MKKILILSLLATFMFAQNPHAFSMLGDVIYNNEQAIDKLKQIPEFKQEIGNIDEYTKEVRRVKRDGFSIDSGDESVDKTNHLIDLRKLSKINDYYIRSVKSSFLHSIDSQNSDLFMNTVNTGLIDTNVYKKEILDYYYMHSNYLIPSGVLKDFLDKDANINKRVKNNGTKEIDREKAKIKRIRQKDRAEQEAVKKLLDEEVKEKKKKIRENQKKELSDVNSN